MRILLKLVLDCPPDAAWRAIRSPEVFRQVSAPLTTFESLDGPFPESWPEGEHIVAVKALGLVPMGRQVIAIGFPRRSDGVRMVRDSGRGLDGMLALVTTWDHRMAVAATADGRTLYRDRLVIGAGILTPLVWPVFWVFWQWRAARLKALARTWR